MIANNRFLKSEDLKIVPCQCINKELENIYSKVFKKKPETYGAKFPDQVIIHWSRSWEYPWAIISSGVKAGDKVLDCGCGGSPLLPFLSHYGCDAYGIDPGLFQRFSFSNHYKYLLKKLLIDTVKRTRTFLLELKNNIRSIQKIRLYLYSTLKDIKKLIVKPKIRANNLYCFYKDPKKLGFKIKFFNESMDDLHFSDNFFDRVFCISVIEHLHKDIAYKGIKEMTRVLKKGGLLIITLDNDGEHVNSELRGAYKDLIKLSGLKLYGESNFEMPNSEDVPGTYNVVGIILKK